MNTVTVFNKEMYKEMYLDNSPLLANLNLDLKSNVSSLSSSDTSSDLGVTNHKSFPGRADLDIENNDSNLEVVDLFSLDDLWNSSLKKDQDGTLDVVGTLESLIDQNEANVDFKNLAAAITDPSHPNKDSNHLEFITVLTITKVVTQINNVLDSTINEASLQKASRLCLALFDLFKYHFELDQSHPNFGFRNFGVLLGFRKYNIIKPFLTTTSLAPKYGFVDQQKLKRCFTVLASMHLMNKHLFDNLIFSFHEKETWDCFCLVFSSKSRTLPSDSNGLYSLFENFNNCATLNQSTLNEDRSSDVLLDSIFAHEPSELLVEGMKSLLRTHDICVNFELSFKHLNELLVIYTSGTHGKEMIALYFWNKPEAFERMFEFVNSGTDITNSKKIGYFLLAKLGEFMVINLRQTSDQESLSKVLMKINNANFTQCLGISEDSQQYKINAYTMRILFEVVDQNFKLNYSVEENLLMYLKTSLRTINSSLETFDSYLELFKLLTDMGSRLSIYSLLETIQFVLSNNLNRELFGAFGECEHTLKVLKAPFGFEFIPPLGKSNFIYENNLNHGDEPVKGLRSETQQMFSVFKTESYRRSTSLKLLKDCVLMCSIIKSKIYVFLRENNDELGIMRFSAEQKLVTKDEVPTKTRAKTGTRLAFFKSQHGLDYKVMNKAVELNLAATIDCLKLCNNYDKVIKFSENGSDFDEPFHRLLYHYQLDSLLSFLLIYKEFGLLSLFKSLKNILLQDLGLIPIASKVLSNLFGFENTSSQPKLRFITGIIHQSEILSNLVRQFVELFDDGYSNSFKYLLNFMKLHPSPIKPSKIPKGTVELDLKLFANAFETKDTKVQTA